MRAPVLQFLNLIKNQNKNLSITAAFYQCLMWLTVIIIKIATSPTIKNPINKEEVKEENCKASAFNNIEGELSPSGGDSKTAPSFCTQEVKVNNAPSKADIPIKITRCILFILYKKRRSIYTFRIFQKIRYLNDKSYQP